MSDYEIPNSNDVSPDDIHPNAGLVGADLSGAELLSADLSGADLVGADLPEANLVDADLSEANLEKADLSGANLRGADLSGANLNSADLSGANLRGADLSGAYVNGVTLTRVKLSRGTEIDPPRELIEAYYEELGVDVSGENVEDKIARVKGNVEDKIARVKGENVEAEVHEVKRENVEAEIAQVNTQLKDEYSRNALLSQGRNARARTRRARRKEVYAEDGWRSRRWFLSRLASLFTGYGIKLKPVVGWMLALYFLSAGVYWYAGGMTGGRSLYYSIVTFTTAPPETPPNYATSIVAGIETFAGTAAIIFLGYVLGSRERI